jgi:hypothetical protein
MSRHRKHAGQVVDISQIPLPAAGLGAELTALLSTCNERLFDLQRQATDIVFAEVAAIQGAWLRAVTAATDLAPHEADRANAARLLEVITDWFQAVTQTQTALVDLLGRSTKGHAAPAHRPHTHAVLVERRKMAIVINFPDRRHAA